jgi:threonine synthase
MRGLARDGGLFVPEALPDLRPFLAGWVALPYAELATRFLRLFATDIPLEELRACAERAYAAFPVPDDPAPLITLNGAGRPFPIHVLELFHGPTLAFKDFALRFLGQLYGRAVREGGHAVNILGATSGDTGSAAIHGMLDQPGTHCFILYPEGRIAPLQERQIACTGSAAVHALAVRGAFDDAQAIVKEILGDAAFSAAHSLTAVNSINIARILAQCVYYLRAALRLHGPEAGAAPLEFVVPTGNFGNVLAGWLLSKMGLCALRFRVATNANDVVARFFNTGRYLPGAVHASLAPSMDIQQASNFERWLWYRFDGDAARVRGTLDTLRRTGSFAFGEAPGGGVTAASFSDAAILGAIREIHGRTGYLADPHTACGLAAALDAPSASGVVPRVVLATAHPAKFPESALAATGLAPAHPTLEALASRPVVKQVLPATTGAVRRAIEEALGGSAAA